MYKTGGLSYKLTWNGRIKSCFFPLINVPAGLWSPHALTSRTATCWTRQRAQARGSARLASQVSRPLRTSLCVRFHARRLRFTQHGMIRDNKKQTLSVETHLFSPGCILCGSNPVQPLRVESHWHLVAAPWISGVQRRWKSLYLTMASK